MSDHLLVLDAYYERLEQLTSQHASGRWQRYGRWALGLGAAGLVTALPLGVAVQHMMMGMMMLGAVITRAPLHRMPAFWVGVVFAAWQIVSIVVTKISGVYDGNPQRGLGLMYIWLAVPAGLVAFHDERVRRWALYGVSVTTTVSAAVALLQFTIGHTEGKKYFLDIHPSGLRFEHGVGFAPIHLTQGYIMAQIALLFMYQRSIVGSAVPLHRVWMATIALGAMMISTARTAIVTFPLGLAAAIAARGGRRLVIAAITMLVSLAVVVGSLWILAPDRVTRMMQGEDGRWAIWRVASVIIKENPLIGCGGANAFEENYRRIYPVVNPTIIDETKGGGHAHAHNSFLTIACEHGIPAALLFLLFLGILLKVGWQMRVVEPTRWALTLGAVTLALAAGMFENLAAHTAPAYATWMVLVLALSAGGRVPHAALKPNRVVPEDQ